MRRSAWQLAASLLSQSTRRGAAGEASSSSSYSIAARLTATSGATTMKHHHLSTSLARAVLRGQQPSTRGVHRMSFPPRPSSWLSRFRQFDADPSKVIWSLIAANGAVYLLWRVDPNFVSKHFVVSVDSLRSGRMWTAVTAAFSQMDTWHLAGNCISLYFFGNGVGQVFGGRRLLLLYLAGGIAGSLAHCGWTLYNARDRSRYGFGRQYKAAMGASAAVNAIMLVDILLFPTRTILLYGFIPMPAALLGLLWLWNDLGGTINGGGSSNVAHAGHLGGAATGLAFYLAFRRGMIRPQGYRW